MALPFFVLRDHQALILFKSRIIIVDKCLKEQENYLPGRNDVTLNSNCGINIGKSS